MRWGDQVSCPILPHFLYEVWEDTFCPETTSALGQGLHCPFLGPDAKMESFSPPLSLPSLLPSLPASLLFSLSPSPPHFPLILCLSPPLPFLSFL